jgi:hypothetical protein
MDALPGVDNIRFVTMVAAKDSTVWEAGDPITSGTVNLYLFATSGAHIGAWFRGSDKAWINNEAVAAVGDHLADSRGHWFGTIDADAWIADTNYYLYGREANGLSIAMGYDVACRTPSTPQTADVATVVAKLAGITLLAKWLRGLFRKDAMDSGAEAEVNAYGGTYVAAAHSLEALGTALVGTGDIPVDHDYDVDDSHDPDQLRVLKNGSPVDGVTLRAYVKADYDAGTRQVVGMATTGSDGRWLSAMMLDADTYYIVASKPGSIVEKSTEVEVS